MSVMYCAAAGYFIGQINPSYIFGKLRGFDIRERGSGNAGASNAMMTMGKAVAVFSAVFDILKAFFAVRLAQILFTDIRYAGELAGTFCIIGHMFPILMNFRGGKGLACLGGTVMAFNMKFFVCILLVEAFLVWLVDYICVVPLTGSVAFPVAYYWITGAVGGALILWGATVAIWYKHMENLKRIHMGVEARVSWIWNREEEEARLLHNLENMR